MVDLMGEWTHTAGMEPGTMPDTNGDRSLRTRLRDLGDHRVASSLVLGFASLALTFGTTVAGIKIALDRSGIGFEERDDPWIAGAVLFGAMVVALFGGILGFLGGVTVLPAALVVILGWSRPMVTAVYTLALEAVTIFVIVLLALWLLEESASPGELVATFVVLGGVVPAVARFLATSDRRRLRHADSA